MFEGWLSLLAFTGRRRHIPEMPALPIRCESVGLTLAGKTLIQNLSLTLESDKISIIMGPNGSGKSLLLRLLHGLIQPDSGAISCGGVPLCASHIREQAMVFQRPVLLRRSVEANLDFSIKLRGAKDPELRARLLALVGLSGREKHAARLLSGGEQQRLALARALSLAPQVLFLDEPTANLDPSSTYMIEQIVRQAQADGIKIVFVTHDIGQARRLGDEVVFVNHGQVIEHQSATEFFKHPSSKEARDYLDGRLVF